MLKERHKEVGVGVSQKIAPFTSGLGALTQESPNPLPNKPGYKLGPAPNNCAKAWILSVEAQVVGIHRQWL